MNNTPTHPLYKVASDASQYKHRHGVYQAVDKMVLDLDTAGIEGAIRQSVSAFSAKIRALKDDVLNGTVTDDEAIARYEAASREFDDLITRMQRTAMSISTSTLYFSTLRLMRHRAGENFATLHDRLDAAVDRGDTRAVEDASRDLFLRLWTGHPLSAEALDQVTLIILDERYPLPTRCQLVAAMTLGLIEYYDENRLLKLLDIYFSADDAVVSLRALTGFMLAMHLNTDRRFSPAILEKIDLLNLHPRWNDDKDMVFCQLIRTLDTERLAERLSKDVIPGLMKMKPLIDDLSNKGEINPEEMFEDNPEWQKMLEESGLQERLVEFSEIAEQGGDLFMSTFSAMKNFPFFNNIENWFIPFATTRSEFASAEFDTFRPLLKGIERGMKMCASDKYSMAFALTRMNDAVRQMINSQLQEHARQLEEIEKSELLPEHTSRKEIVNFYVQDLYRFYKLFSRASEMTNPFVEPFNMLKIKALHFIEPSDETLRLVGDFYLKHHLYDDALTAFILLERRNPMAVDVLQKLAVCKYRTHSPHEAVAYLEKADLISGDDYWTMLNLGRYFLQIDRFEEGIRVMTRVMSHPESQKDLRAHATLIRLYIKTGNLDAMKGVLEKARLEGLLDSTRGRLLEAEALTWTDDYFRALDIYRRLRFDGITLKGADLAAMACCEWLAGFREDAIATMQQAVAATPSTATVGPDAVTPSTATHALEAAIHPRLAGEHPALVPFLTSLLRV
ncbi:MAG: hypothetical protein J1E63_00480 [Muribaculaceae bacterium]|nr:hypothetical protein [Muribaculaceae bacterium]